MSKFGGWKEAFNTNYPQKIASGFYQLTDVVGADYKPIAYLGYQEVNGTNHAVLAEQTLLVGKDTKNAVVLVFNEKPKANDVSLSDIRRIVESGGEFGGTKVDMTTEFPKEAIEAFNEAFEGFVGTKVEPLVYIGQKISKGIDYKFLARTTPVVLNPESDLALVTVNSMDKKITFEHVFDVGSDEPQKLGYCIVKGKKVTPDETTNAPLGEWP